MTRQDRLAIDVVMSLGILVAFVPSVTGMALHEIISVSIIVPCLVHMVVNWDWTVRVLRDLARKASGKSRFDLAVDVALFVSAVTVMLSGFMVSTVLLPILGITAEGGSVWRALHSLAADTTLLCAIVHLVSHGEWVADTMRGVGSRKASAPVLRQEAGPR